MNGYNIFEKTLRYYSNVFMRKVFYFILFTQSIIACEQKVQQPITSKLSLPFQEYSQKNDSVQTELDEIYSLLAYSIVYQDWQPDSVPRFERRGYNIGTVLVDKNNEAVHWALNCVNSTDNATQHGEVRAITSYLDSLAAYNLRDFTLYTTLEPCVMCAGMMTMTSVKRVVYGQKDVDFSNALERLSLDTEKLGGYAPYPRTVLPDPAPTQFRNELDSAFKYFLETEEEKYLAKFLTTTKANQIYEEAYEAFKNYTVKHSENEDKYLKAIEFLKDITL